MSTNRTRIVSSMARTSLGSSVRACAVSERRVDGFVEGTRPFRAGQDTDTLLIFGDVDQLKIIAERLNQNPLMIEIERRNRGIQIGVGLRIVAAAFFCQRTDFLDERQRFGLVLFDNNFADSPPSQA